MTTKTQGKHTPVKYEDQPKKYQVLIDGKWLEPIVSDRLLNAAPELLEACKKTLDILADAEGDKFFSVAQAQQIISTLKQAIAKAK